MTFVTKALDIGICRKTPFSLFFAWIDTVPIRISQESECDCIGK
jgi:hypothetical protein